MKQQDLTSGAPLARCVGHVLSLAFVPLLFAVTYGVAATACSSSSKSPDDGNGGEGGSGGDGGDGGSDGEAGRAGGKGGSAGSMNGGSGGGGVGGSGGSAGGAGGGSGGAGGGSGGAGGAGSRIVTRIRFYPRKGHAQKMLNGRFSGSNVGPTETGAELHKIVAAPADGQWTEVAIQGAPAYRYLKFDSPSGGFGNVAEVEFYAGTRKLTGRGYGTAGSFMDSGTIFEKALDGDVDTYFHAPNADGNYVGIDLGSDTTGSGGSGGAAGSGGSGGNMGSGGSPGSGGSGGGTATAFSARRIYHVGNSLTDSIRYGSFQETLMAGNFTYTYGRHMIPGAPLEWIWDHPNDGFSEEPYGHYGKALPGFTWDVLTLQPYDRQLAGPDGDIATAINFIKKLHERQENRTATRVYIYQRWPARKQANESAPFVLDYPKVWLSTFTGGYDDTNQTRDYQEKLIQGIRAMYTVGNPVLLIPNGDVLYELHQKMKAGQIPGFTDVTQLYSDGVHLTNVGHFTVAMTVFATCYRRTPVGLSPSKYVGEGAGDRAISDALARAIQEVVWQVVSTHALAGVRQ